MIAEKEIKCIRETCVQIAKPGRLYCSTSCAQSDPARQESSLPLTKKAKSSSKEHGAVLDQSSNGDVPQGVNMLQSKKTWNLEKSKEKPKEELTAITAGKKPRINGKFITQEQVTNERYYTEEEQKMRDEQSLTVQSLSLSESLNVAKSHSMSLIDESARHLQELMRSAARVDPNALYLDPRGVKAACEAAKQMGNLLRLKLDIMKEFRKR